MEIETLESELYTWLVDNANIESNSFFMSKMPDTKNVSNGYWLIYLGGDIEQQNPVHSKTYLHTFTLNYRNTKSELVDKEITRLTRLINSTSCMTLPDYEIVWFRAQAFNSNEGSDNENYYQGSVSIQLRELFRYD